MNTIICIKIIPYLLRNPFPPPPKKKWPQKPFFVCTLLYIYIYLE